MESSEARYQGGDRDDAPGLLFVLREEGSLREGRVADISQQHEDRRAGREPSVEGKAAKPHLATVPTVA